MATKTATKPAAKKPLPVDPAERAGDKPLLDLNNDSVKKMIKAAKKRGYVTVDELNAVMPSEEVSPDQIEDTMSMLSEMGINVVEEEEAEEQVEEVSSELVETGKKALATTKKKEPTDRTDDPVRMYLREMGSVELLSREGEIAIAKRIEAGRETMIAGLCESPLTFQAIIIWRDELLEENILLRDIIDLDATYAGPDAKQNVPVNPNAPASVAEAVRQGSGGEHSPEALARKKLIAEGKDPDTGRLRRSSTVPRKTMTTRTMKPPFRWPQWKRNCAPKCWKSSIPSPTITRSCAAFRTSMSKSAWPTSGSRPHRNAA